MDKNFDDSQKLNIELLQTKVDEYQKNPELCADLTSEQYIILAELQTIYNLLQKKTVSNDPALYNFGCVGVKNAMEQFTEIYTSLNPTILYENYIQKYKKAKEQPYKLIELLDIAN